MTIYEDPLQKAICWGSYRRVEKRLSRHPHELEIAGSNPASTILLFVVYIINKEPYEEFYD